MTWLKSIFKKKQDTTAGSNAKSNDLQLEGIVRGFKESRQIKPGPATPYDSEVIVWTFQLERHSETEEHLDPIPVEMRGKYFSGFINEGNVVRLYEKSWDGGIVRTKRVFNVTYKDDIEVEKTITTRSEYTFKKKNTKSNDLQLEGIVRGFKESRQIKPGPAAAYDSEMIVWTFQLERHSETEEHLDPIPVEMRGKYFSGMINEGNIVRLNEKSWDGGIVRTKRVLNVTYKDDIMAHG